MPLAFGENDRSYRIVRIAGNDRLKIHLQKMGFVLGKNITIVSKLNGNLIVALDNLRLAISKETAMKIIVEEDV